MSSRWFAPDLLFDGRSLFTDQAVEVENGTIISVGPAPVEAHPIAGILTPGFIDLQVNGGGGEMLNSNPSRDTIATIATAHRRFGTVAILPTVITDRAEVLEDAANAVLAAKTIPGVLGLHIEGPHIAEARKGTHSAEFIRPLDDRTLSVVTHLRGIGLPVMITLAPEVTPHDQITALAATGAVVSLGHTNATAAEINAAIAAGASCATHLFNAMSPMTSREPGAVGAVINSDIYAGIIGDGYHVDDSMVGLAIRARPVPDRMILVSDAMATVGGPDHFSLYGHDVHLKDGRLINKDGGLAGAHITQAEAVARLVKHVGIAPETALRMAISNPANCMGVPELASPVGRRVEDLIVLDESYLFQQDLATYLNADVAPDAAE